MNSTASAVMTCAVAERATIDTVLLPRSGAQRGWPDGTANWTVAPGLGIAGCRGPALREGRPVPPDGTAGALFAGRGDVHLFVHQLIHTGPNVTRGPRRTGYDWRRQTPRPGASVSCQRWSGPSSRPPNGSSASRRLPSRSTQSARDATAADAAIATDVSSMQPRNVRKPSSFALASICAAGPGPPHFASLTFTPAVTPTSASRSSI